MYPSVHVAFFDVGSSLPPCFFFFSLETLNPHLVGNYFSRLATILIASIDYDFH